MRRSSFSWLKCSIKNRSKLSNLYAENGCPQIRTQDLMVVLLTSALANGLANFTDILDLKPIYSNTVNDLQICQVL